MVAMNKRPIQVYLRPDQLDSLRTLSKVRGVSLAELVRQGIDCMLAQVPVEHDPLLDIIGIVDSGVPDLAEKHDQYLAQWLFEESHRAE